MLTHRFFGKFLRKLTANGPPLYMPMPPGKKNHPLPPAVNGPPFRKEESWPSHWQGGEGDGILPRTL